MITPSAELWTDDSAFAWDGHLPIAGRRDHQLPPPALRPTYLDLAFILLRRDCPAWRMSRIAHGSARVVTTRSLQVVTLHTDDPANLGMDVHLTGLAPSASRHVAGTLALAHRGTELGDTIPWSLPRTPGSACLQALPLRHGGSLYLMTRVAGPYDRTETPLTQ